MGASRQLSGGNRPSADVDHARNSSGRMAPVRALACGIAATFWETASLKHALAEEAPVPPLPRDHSAHSHGFNWSAAIRSRWLAQLGLKFNRTAWKSFYAITAAGFSCETLKQCAT